MIISIFAGRAADAGNDPVPELTKSINLAKKFKKFPIRRQDAPKTYDMNASIYIWKRNILLKSDNLFRKKTSIYIMDFERSIDVDSKFDLSMIKNLIKKTI